MLNQSWFDNVKPTLIQRFVSAGQSIELHLKKYLTTCDIYFYIEMFYVHINTRFIALVCLYACYCFK